MMSDHTRQDGRGISRRRLVQATTALAAGAVAPLLLSQPASGQVDFAAMRQRWRAGLVTTGYDAADPHIASLLQNVTSAAESARSTLNRAAGRTYLWADAQFSTADAFHVSRSFARLRAMAISWATEGSGHYNSGALLTDVISGMDWMVDNFYSVGGPIDPGWYERRISGPNWFQEAILLVYPHLSSAQVQSYAQAVRHYNPSPFDVGANRALTSFAIFGSGVLGGSSSHVTTGVNGMASVLPYVTSDDGFYRDGSFIQHDWYAYLGAYGASILEGLVPMTRAVTGSGAWSIDATNPYNWVRDSFDPVIWRGGLMDFVSGRTISRFSEGERVHFRGALPALLGLVNTVPTASLRQQLRGVVKEWIVSDNSGGWRQSFTVPSLIAANALLADTSVPARGLLQISKVFPRQDRIVHRRQGWAVAIAMYSNRTRNFETNTIDGIGENFRGWFTAEGATFFYPDNSEQYVDGYWPTVDPYRLPGTTVDVRTRTNNTGHGALGSNAWAGGATLNGLYTAAGMNVRVQGTGTAPNGLHAYKSWMCLDNEVVALGADITYPNGPDNVRVISVLDTRKVAGVPTITRKPQDPAPPAPPAGEVVALAADGQVSNHNDDWIHIAGVGGYVFPQNNADPVTIRRDTRTGRWADLTNHPAYDETGPITRRYVSLWFDHDVRPTNRFYVYVVLPNATLAQTRVYYADQPVQILANSLNVQAVRHVDLGVLAANLWQANQQISILRSEAGGSFVLSEIGDELTLAIANPGQNAPASFRVYLQVQATGVLSADPGLSVTLGNPVVITVSGAAGFLGQSRTVRLRISPVAAATVRQQLSDQLAAGELDRAAFERLDRRLSRLKTRAGRPELMALRHELGQLPRSQVTPAAASLIDDSIQRMVASG